VLLHPVVVDEKEKMRFEMKKQKYPPLDWREDSNRRTASFDKGKVLSTGSSMLPKIDTTISSVY
jgi:hypothetical protein